MTAELLRGDAHPDTEVLWVNTIGTRPPRLDWLTLRRGLQKVGSWLRPAADADSQDLPQRLQVANPRMWPWVASPVARRINRRLLDRQLSPLVAAQSAPRIGVTTIPIAALVMDVLPIDRWVYYCVDDFSVWPGLDGPTLLSLEREVVERADVIVCASDSLAARIAGFGRSATVVTHGVDVDFWSTAAGRPPVASAVGLPPAIAAAQHPLAVFWGVVDRRLDTAWLAQLAAASEIGTVALVGPQQNPDPAIFELPNVVTTGAVPMSELPAIAAAADVLVMPYRDEAVTRAMQPLKLKEYLATGRPVVVRRLPATEPWSDCCDVVDDPEAFVAMSVQRTGQVLPPQEQQAARERLAKESWRAKADDFWRQVF